MLVDEVMNHGAAGTTATICASRWTIPPIPKVLLVDWGCVAGIAAVLAAGRAVDAQLWMMMTMMNHGCIGWYGGDPLRQSPGEDADNADPARRRGYMRLLDGAGWLILAIISSPMAVMSTMVT